MSGHLNVNFRHVFVAPGEDILVLREQLPQLLSYFGLHFGVNSHHWFWESLVQHNQFRSFINLALFQMFLISGLAFKLEWQGWWQFAKPR